MTIEYIETKKKIDKLKKIIEDINSQQRKEIESIRQVQANIYENKNYIKLFIAN